MAFEITKTFVVNAPAGKVWQFLTDPQRVARCLPGAAVTGKIDEKTWAGTMTVKVGPVQSSYKGKMSFEKLDPASRTAEIVAAGQDVRGKGGADLRLTSSLREIAPGQTEVTTVSRVNVSGILAQMGRGMINDVSDQIFQAFSQRMRGELEEPASPATGGARSGGAQLEEPASPATGGARSGGAQMEEPASPAPPDAPPAAGPAQEIAPPILATPAPGEALDLGSIGTRAALRRPGVWITVVALAVVLYLLLR